MLIFLLLKYSTHQSMKKIVYMGTDNLIFLLVFITSILLFVRNLRESLLILT